MKLAFGTSLLFITTNVTAQWMLEVQSEEVEAIEIPKQTNDRTYRAKAINRLRYAHYSHMLKEVRDIQDAAIYCNSIAKHAGNNSDYVVFGKNDYWASFNESFSSRKQDCDDIAIAVASLLYDNDFHPYFLLLKTEIPTRAHIVFIYKNQKNQFGSIGKGKDTKKAKYEDINDLIHKFSKDYGLEFSPRRCAIIDAAEIFPNAIFKKENFKKYLRIEYR